MTARRDRLLAVNARLSVPLASPGSNSHVPEPDPQAQSLDNGLMDDARHGKSPRPSAAPVPNFTSLRVTFSHSFTCTCYGRQCFAVVCRQLKTHFLQNIDKT